MEPDDGENGQRRLCRGGRREGAGRLWLVAAQVVGVAEQRHLAWIGRRKREGGDVERGVVDSSYTKCHEMLFSGDESTI